MPETAMLLQKSIGASRGQEGHRGGRKGARVGNKGAREGKKGAVPFYFGLAGTPVGMSVCLSVGRYVGIP